jgi:NADPH-dependent 2,4-dienoyl-CoA reductase/sulfur reductase-like enzyme
MSAASQARRLCSDLEIVAYERGSYVSYAACGEPYYIGGGVDDLDSLVARTPEQFADRDIEVRTRHEVVEIDLSRRLVTVRDLEGGEVRAVGFDHLMLATGSKPLRPDYLTGINLPGVAGLRTLEDAEAIKQLVDAGLERVVMLGGGYIGIEVAEALVDRGVQVTMVTSGSHVLERTLDGPIGELANQAVRDYGVDLHTGIKVRCIQSSGARGFERASGVGCDGIDFPADLIVIGLGAAPETGLAVAAGIPLGESGAVAVDEYQRTPIEAVWAAGDCAEVLHRVSGRPVNIPLGTVANKSGRIAGTNIAAAVNGSHPATFPGALGTAITKIGEVEISRTGLKLEEATGAGFDPVFGLARGTNAASYWPSARRADVMLIADRRSGRLLGGQIVGGPGSGKKIDVLAAALWSEMTVEDLAWMDLAYAPPFGGVWDLIHIAARRTVQSS